MKSGICYYCENYLKCKWEEKRSFKHPVKTENKGNDNEYENTER